MNLYERWSTWRMERQWRNFQKASAELDAAIDRLRQVLNEAEGLIQRARDGL